MSTRFTRLARRGLVLALVTSTVLLTASLGSAGEESKRSAAQKGAKDPRLKTRKLWNLEWHADWKAAMLRNRMDPRSSRPIFHLRILGDLAAKT